MTEGNIYEAVDRYSKQGRSLTFIFAMWWENAALPRNLYR